ncbi:MAG: hypothetical protein JW854_16945 [Actinobacteria bacterium]|nr:hypothetical protein [Actinomycetota bacterium]
MTDSEGIVPDCIPASLVAEGLVFSFSMARSKPRNIAWEREAALEVIATLAQHGYAILGGDVLERSGDGLAYAGEYWDLPDEDVVLWDEYVEHTRERSAAFIEEVAGRRGDSCVFALFWLSERDYKRQMRDFGSLEYR